MEISTDKMTIEDMLRKNNNIDIIEQTSEEFNRIIKFVVLDKLYEIEWWCNICYLHINDIIVPFHSISIDGCWPNHYKTNINFIYFNQKVCILPIEKYEEE